MTARSGELTSALQRFGQLFQIAYNLVVQVRRLAATGIHIEPSRPSFTGVWSLVKTILTSRSPNASEAHAASPTGIRAPKNLSVQA